MTPATVTTPLLSNQVTAIPLGHLASSATIIEERKIARSMTDEIVLLATTIYNAVFCALTFTSLFAAPHSVFFENDSALQKAHHITLEAYVITALIGAAAQSLKLINNALQPRIADKQQLMIAKIACCIPLLTIGCIMLADASAVLLARRLPYVFVVAPHGPMLKYVMGAVPTIVLYGALAALNNSFIYNEVYARLKAFIQSKNNMVLLTE
jgi:hypothetical protein